MSLRSFVCGYPDLPKAGRRRRKHADFILDILDEKGEKLLVIANRGLFDARFRLNEQTWEWEVIEKRYLPYRTVSLRSGEVYDSLENSIHVIDELLRKASILERLKIRVPQEVESAEDDMAIGG